MEKGTCIFIGGKQLGANCLKELLKSGFRPALVIPNLDDTGEDDLHESVVKIALQNNLPLIRDRKVREKEIVEKIKSLRPAIIFSIGGMQIIPREVLEIPRDGVVNIHPALLPKYRGRFSTAHAIFNGEKYTGVTLHLMDEGIDSGPIISQEKIAIEENDTAKSLYDKFTNTGSIMFARFLEGWLKGEKIVSYPQNEKEATYYPVGLPNNGEIDWSWDGEKIKRFIRAMTFPPYPPPKFKLGEQTMVIVDEKEIKN